MPQPRRLTNQQEDAAVAMNDAGLTIAELARTYGLTWQGMKDCLDRARRRAANPSFTGNLEGLDGAA